MNKKVMIILLLFMCLSLTVGCEGMIALATRAIYHDVRAKEEGTAKVYPVNADQSREIAKTVFRWEGADAIEEHKSESYMFTSSGIYLVSWGEVMGAWIEPVDKDNTRVTVVTKRRIATNIATTLTETTFHKRFAQAVKIILKGEKLPTVPPELD